MAVSTTTVSIIMNNWFIKNKGLVIGIAMAGSGFGGMQSSTLSGQQLIANFGHQTAYIILACVMLVVFVPVMAAYRFKPRDMALKPLGYEEAQNAEGYKEEKDAQGKEEVVREGATTKRPSAAPSSTSWPSSSCA